MLLLQAQFYIFEKVKSEMRLAAQDEVHLRSEVVVPKATIGRIIGKGGQNVSNPYFKSCDKCLFVQSTAVSCLLLTFKLS